MKKLSIYDIINLVALVVCVLLLLTSLVFKFWIGVIVALGIAVVAMVATMGIESL